jgi:MoaA/NifB/PqqE/SkfB family radical SAM enzyme
MPTELFYGEEMESIRQAMREGRRHSACETCWRIEDSGVESGSYRLQSVPPGYFKDFEVAEQLIDNPQLQSIDFAFGENCNLRCRMCAPGLSNKLRIDYKYFVDHRLDTRGIQQFDYNTNWNLDDEDMSDETMLEHDINLKPDASSAVHNFAHNAQWQNILDNIHTLKHIKGTGGETLLSKPFIEFIDTAIERDVARNIYLEFHTNATKFTDDIISKLVQFEGLHLNLSIDSIGKNYEYIRYPMPWDKLCASLNNFLTKTADARSPRDLNKSWEKRDYLIKTVSFNVVMSALNLHYLPELFEFQRDLLEPYKNIEYSIFYVDLLWPENKYINVKFLPPRIKREQLERLKQTRYDKNQLLTQTEVAEQFILKYIDYEPTEQDRLNMLREITVFDKSRNQQYNNYLHPEIVEFLETPIA